MVARTGGMLGIVVLLCMRMFYYYFLLCVPCLLVCLSKMNTAFARMHVWLYYGSNKANKGVISRLYTGYAILCMHVACLSRFVCFLFSLFSIDPKKNNNMMATPEDKKNKKNTRKRKADTDEEPPAGTTVATKQKTAAAKEAKPKPKRKEKEYEVTVFYPEEDKPNKTLKGRKEDFTLERIEKLVKGTIGSELAKKKGLVCVYAEDGVWLDFEPNNKIKSHCACDFVLYGTALLVPNSVYEYVLQQSFQ